MYDMLKELGAQHIKIFGGGGGTITEEEIASLEEYGIEKDLSSQRRYANGPRWYD